MPQFAGKRKERIESGPSNTGELLDHKVSPEIKHHRPEIAETSTSLSSLSKDLVDAEELNANSNTPENMDGLPDCAKCRKYEETIEILENSLRIHEELQKKSEATIAELTSERENLLKALAESKKLIDKLKSTSSQIPPQGGDSVALQIRRAVEEMWEKEQCRRGLVVRGLPESDEATDYYRA